MTLGRHQQLGYFSLAEGPQRAPLDSRVFGTDWWELDQYLKFYFGQFIVLTGVAGSGKSTLLLNIVCRLARVRGIHSFLYVPENEATLENKLRKIWNDDDTFEVFAERQCFYQSALSEHSGEDLKTMQWVLQQAVVGIEHDGVNLVVIDPWNELERAKPRDMLLTDYITVCLMQLKDFVRAHDVICIVVAHPTKSINDKGGVPTLADIEGSMAWWNKCDNGLILVRERENACQLISAKVREAPEAGKVGRVHFTVDPATGIFTPQYGGISDEPHERTAPRRDYGVIGGDRRPRKNFGSGAGAD